MPDSNDNLPVKAIPQVKDKDKQITASIKSVWELEAFPNKTNKIKFTPKQLQKTLIEFGETETPLPELLKKRKIRYTTFWDLVGLYPEIRVAYSDARTKKAHIWHQEGHAIYNSEPPDWCYEATYNKDGDIIGKKLSAPGIRFLEGRYNSRMRSAEIAETGQIAQKTQIESKSINVNINADLPSPEDLAALSLDDLYEISKRVRGGQG